QPPWPSAGWSWSPSRPRSNSPAPAPAAGGCAYTRPPSPIPPSAKSSALSLAASAAPPPDRFDSDPAGGTRPTRGSTRSAGVLPLLVRHDRLGSAHHRPAQPGRGQPDHQRQPHVEHGVTASPEVASRTVSYPNVDQVVSAPQNPTPARYQTGSGTA